MDLAAKYFGKYEWIKDQTDYDGHPKLYNDKLEEGENPLQTFGGNSERDLRSKEMIKAVLLKDKEIGKQLYADSLGVSIGRLYRTRVEYTLLDPILQLGEKGDRYFLQVSYDLV